MNDHSLHDLAELSEQLDGRLPEPRRLEVVERLRQCVHCRDAQASLLWAKGQARKLADADAPAGLEAMVQAGLRSAGARLDEARLPIPARAARWRHRLPALAAAATLVVGLAFVLCATRPPFSDLAARGLGGGRPLARGGAARAGGRGVRPRRLEAFLADQRLGFEARVLDLGMMGFALRGGSAGLLAGHRSALMIYRETATGREVLCRMLREGLTALPPPHETRQHNGIPFQIYHLGEVTVVFWPEGRVLCALAGRGEPEALVQLAFGKAMKATARD